MPQQFMRIAGISVKSAVRPNGWEDFTEQHATANEASIQVHLVYENAPEAFFSRANWFDIQTVLQRTSSAAPLGGGDWLLRNPLSREALPIRCSQEYRQITVYCPDDMLLQREEALSLLRTAFECRFCYEGIVSLHAACVEGDSYAVCFTGDSGVGKSTRAQAWVEGLGAKFISGDRPAIRLEADGCTVCGVPWDGKEQIFRNVERPLTAIFEVRRAAFTRLRRLSADQAYGVLMRQSFIPMWDADAAALAMANVRRLSRSVPVYRLFCGPSAEDARAVYEILMNHPEEIREEKDDMKIRNGFVLRSVVDEYMVMPTGENIEKYDGAVVMNEVSAFVFQQLEHGISRDDLLTAVMNEFDVDEATAAADLDELLAQFGKMGLLED